MTTHQVCDSSTRHVTGHGDDKQEELPQYRQKGGEEGGGREDVRV